MFYSKISKAERETDAAILEQAYQICHKYGRMVPIEACKGFVSRGAMERRFWENLKSDLCSAQLNLVPERKVV